MDFYEVVNRRRTVRDFGNEGVPNDALERIISAAFKAPTNDHMRDWQFMVINNKALAGKLLEVIPKSTTEEEVRQLIKEWNLTDLIQQDCYKNAVPKQYRMLFGAAAIIVPLFKQKTDILNPQTLSDLNGFASIWCAIENIFLAATEEGFACNLRIPLGNEAEYAKEVLRFPDEYFMPCFIGIGKPKPGIIPVKQKEINLRERIHWNNY